MTAESLGEATPQDLRVPWSTLRSIFTEYARTGIAGWIDESEPHFRAQLTFALSRVDQGMDLLKHCESHEALPPRRVDVLDIGAGNGGVAFAFANRDRYRVHAIDIVPNSALLAVRRATSLRLDYTVGSGHALPYPSSSFDIGPAHRHDRARSSSRQARV